ncbi:MAG: DUF1080 domain-containing protein [Bacteroidota bacterium]|nr:DUF1080 domain-containing protein [Bacteroidota bacterium]
MNRIFLFFTLLFIASSCANQGSPNESTEWISLFDGKTLDGWRISENPEAFKIEDGIIIAHGDRAHLFYEGPIENHNFKNFEFKADIMTFPGSNSGIFIHTQYQDTDWPSKGYEIQVNNTHTDWRKTSSIYAVQDIKEAPAQDNKWFTQHIIVDGKNITVKVDDKVINEYTEGEDGRLSGGTFALQAHDPESIVHYKNIMVKVLPD